MNKALFIGRSVVDVLSHVRRFPEPDEKVKALNNDIFSGGSSLNAAVTFAHLGGEAFLYTSLSESGIDYDLIANELRSRNIKYNNINLSPNYKIPHSTVISSQESSERIIINGFQEESDKTILYDYLPLDDFDLIQLDQYEVGFVMNHKQFFESFKGSIVLDGGSWKNCSLDFLKIVDIPIVSEVFCVDGIDAFAKMCKELNIDKWAVTRGKNGVVWHDRNSDGVIKASQIDAIDTLGAGDIFHGAFCHYYLKSSDFKRSLEAANEIAGRSCLTIGTRSWMDE